MFLQILNSVEDEIILKIYRGNRSEWSHYRCIV